MKIRIKVSCSVFPNNWNILCQKIIRIIEKDGIIVLDSKKKGYDNNE